MRWLAAMACAALVACVSHHAGPMPGEPDGARFAAIDGARIRYTDAGSGPPVVLVHGFASSLETWDLLAPQLARRNRVIALDLKGFGWSDRPEGDYSPEAQAKLVWALLDSLKIDRASVVGHSWGASIALAMTLAQPERVARVALYDAWVFEEQLPTFFHLARAPGLGEAMFSLWYDERPDDKLEHAFYDKDRIPEPLVAAVEKALERPGTKAAALAAVRGQRFADVEARYRTITQPALVLWGREDEVTTLSMGERLARELPKARLVVYPRCGHFPMLEAATASTAELAAFLSQDPS